MTAPSYAPRRLVATRSGKLFPFAHLAEFSEDGESLELVWEGVEKARIRAGQTLLQRFRAFLPFQGALEQISMGEGQTPILPASALLRDFTGLSGLLLKQEAQNPTWSFKDRGSVANCWLAAETGEQVLATVSTGNMGASLAAYAAHTGKKCWVFVPQTAAPEKLEAMLACGASVVRVQTADLTALKQEAARLASLHQIRLISGNNPHRLEGYKLLAFELFEQLKGQVPDWVVVPTSAGGHIRGIDKGFRELFCAGYIRQLPRMVVVQPAQNAPLANAIRQGVSEMQPVSRVQTVASALTSGYPPGGNDLLYHALQAGWLGAAVSEEEIMEGQRLLARSGLFIEPSAATVLFALRNLRQEGLIRPGSRVVAVLTGAGTKDPSAWRQLTLPSLLQNQSEIPLSELHVWLDHEIRTQ